jgi:hypothetical protein
VVLVLGTTPNGASAGAKPGMIDPFGVRGTRISVAPSAPSAHIKQAATIALLASNPASAAPPRWISPFT